MAACKCNGDCEDLVVEADSDSQSETGSSDDEDD